MRKVSKLEAYITIQHIELMNIVIMITGSIVGVAYITGYLSLGILVLSMSSAFLNRATGPYWWAYLMMMSCNVLSPQFLCGLRTVLCFPCFIHCC
jgi:molybdopterin-containing oxidoreductase family membrane subunit